MNILGIWDGHDAGAALVLDGRLRVAVNEERLTRRKLEVRFPSRSIQACLTLSGLPSNAVDLVAVSTSDVAKTLGRWWPASKEQYYAVRRRKTPPGATASLTRALKYRITEWRPGKISAALSRVALRRSLEASGLGAAPVTLIDHHEGHAAAAAWASGFPSCAVLTIDGVGDGLSSSISTFRQGRLTRVAASSARHSLGVFFEHVTSLLNMRELEDEGKVMALADYAAPIPDDQNPLLGLIRVQNGVIATVRAGHALRRELERVHWHYANEQFAYLAQRTVEETCLALARDTLRMTGESRLAVAGGVASNIRAMRRIRRLPEIADVYVFPHMGDGGLALGSAVVAAADAGESIVLDLGDLGLGHEFSASDMASALTAAGFSVTAASEQAVVGAVASALERGEVAMWFQGRMEYGPRALGHRSVLARPDRLDVRDRLNLVLKRRVWYQPFCPSLLAPDAAKALADWTGPTNWPMTMAYEVAPAYRTQLAGVMSIDGTCRPQVVPEETPGPFAALLREGRARWGLGAVLNTSFNIHGEPLVCTPAEAVDVFLRSGADLLALGPYLVTQRAPAARHDTRASI